jgi:hypothetical protein
MILKDKKGAAAILSIVIVTASALIMAISASNLGLGELDLGYTSQRGNEALFLADGCMEETLQRIRLDTNYGVGYGDINLNLGNGSCIINVTQLTANRRRVNIASTVGVYNKKIESDITLSGNNITIDLWSEKDN